MTGSNLKLRELMLVPALASALLLSACGSDKPKAPAAAAGKTEAAAPLELDKADVSVVKLGVLAAGLPITGTLQAYNQTTVQARVPSDVAAVLVREGEHVKKGQVLARLGTQELEARLSQAQANLASAKVEADLARGLVERNQKLYDKKYFSEIDFKRSVGEAEAREEAVRAQQALVAIARKSLNDAVVAAPMTGIVARRYVDPGSSVGMDAKLFDLVELSDLELAAPVPAPEIPAVKIGQTATFAVDGFGGRQFQGQVVRINPVADVGTRAITVYIRVQNADQSLKGGMFARGTIASGSGDSSLIVPLDAVRREPGKAPYVFVFKDGRLQLRTVELGQTDERAGQVTVRSGVAEGETVVIARLTAAAANRPAKLSAGS